MTHGPVNDLPGEANARLMAAAPDLLNAAKAALPLARECARHIITPRDNLWARLARDLEVSIAKAEGGAA